MTIPRHTGEGMRAFTLIELLVVIAIIGVLSATVLASLGAGRTKATDSSIKSNFHTVAVNASLDFAPNGGSYGTTAWVWNASSFPVGTGVPGTATGLFNDMVVGTALNETARLSGSISYGSNPTSYVVVAQLKNGGYWCIDSQGNTKALPENSYNAPTGPTSNYLSGGVYACR